MNNVTLIGRLTRDIELRETSKQTAYANITVAVDSPYKEGADFINCTLWGVTAENSAKYLHKGDKLAVTGRLEQNVYKDSKHSDVTHYETYVNVDRVEFLNAKKEPTEEPNEEPKSGRKYNRSSRR